MQTINDFILRHAGDPWVVILTGLLCVLDGFFPPLPSESVVVGLSAVSHTGGEPNLIVLGVIAACGVFIGDNIAFLIGRRLGSTKLLTGGPRRQRSLAWARRNLHRRAAVLILCARFIPVGRVAVNMTAGATGFSRSRFLSLTALSATMWSIYSIMIGTVAGKALHDNPLLAAVLGIFLAVLIGTVLDVILTRAFGTQRPHKPVSDTSAQLQQ